MLNKKLALKLICGALFIALFMMPSPAFAQSSSFDPQSWLKDILTSIQGMGFVGVLAFIALYIVCTIAFLPGSILTFGGGVVFGVVLGSVYVLIGAILGAIGAFLVGRYLARDWITQKISKMEKFAAIDRAVTQEGLKIVFLTRLSPVFPFSLLNYAFGVTGVSLRDYALGSIGMVPGTVMYVYIGSIAGNLTQTTTQPHPEIQWAIRIVGFLATIGVSVYATNIARKALVAEVEL